MPPARGSRGHRALPHTADARIEAWGPTREECIAEAVHAVVDGFLDTTGARARSSHRRHVSARDDAGLLVAVLEEVLFWLDTTGHVPVEVHLEPEADGVGVRCGTVPAATLPRTGAVPKAVALHDLRIGRHGPRWSCRVTLDV